MSSLSATARPSAIPIADGRHAGLLLLRVALATMWISHGLLKLVVFTLPGTVAFFESKGIPGALVYLVVPLEIAGGLAILFGIYARQVSLLLLPILIGALWTHLPNGWVFTATGGGWEYPLFLIVASLVSWLSGDGGHALRPSTRFTVEPRA
jgi:putative oxidoreductase